MWGAGLVRETLLVAVGRGAFLPVLAVLASDFWRGQKDGGPPLVWALGQSACWRLAD